MFNARVEHGYSQFPEPGNFVPSCLQCLNNRRWDQTTPTYVASVPEENPQGPDVRFEWVGIFRSLAFGWDFRGSEWSDVKWWATRRWGIKFATAFEIDKGIFALKIRQNIAVFLD